MLTFSNPRRWSWQWSWTACTEESATRASTQTQSSSTRRSASLCFLMKVFKVFKNIFQGAGRVAFSNQQSYIAAISARFVQLQHGEIDKRVEVGRMKIIESEKYLFSDIFCSSLSSPTTILIKGETIRPWRPVMRWVSGWKVFWLIKTNKLK